MAHLMQHYNHAFVKMLPQDRYKELMTMWNSGLVDSKVMPAIMAKRKEFEPRDLAFLALQDDRAFRDFLNPAGTAEKQDQGGSSRDPQLGFSAGQISTPLI